MKIRDNKTSEIWTYEKLKKRYPVGTMLNSWGDVIESHEVEEMISTLNMSYDDCDPVNETDVIFKEKNVSRYEILR